MSEENLQQNAGPDLEKMGFSKEDIAGIKAPPAETTQAPPQPVPVVQGRSGKQVRLEEVERYHKQLSWIGSILAHLTRRHTEIEVDTSDEFPCNEKDVVEHELNLLEQRGEGIHAVQSYVDQRRKEIGS